MSHATPLIAIIVAGLVLAFIFGGLAFKLRLPPLVGYLLAGVVVGPFTPGYVADQRLANELAELGVILLMFGVGLHFSLKDLLAVRKIAIPGAIAQITVATLLGMGLAHLMGWSMVGGVVFGLSLSVASTVVLLRALQERRILDTERGRIAIGWLIVEDLMMVLTLVLIPALAGAHGGKELGLSLFLTIGKMVAFVAFMLIVGRRVVPWMLHVVAHSGSRELFRLSVLAIALGVAFGAAMLFGVSFALGAFFAGMILSESPLSQRAAEETLPLRDAFAVLFFVSVGMLFNPNILMTAALPLLGTIAIIMIGKSLAAYWIVRSFGKSRRTAATISASLAQIGEFSFILATLGVGLKLFPPEARDLILAGAIISIMLNPLVFSVAAKWLTKREPDAPTTGLDAAIEPAAPQPRGHVVLIGYGRVGRIVGASLTAAREKIVVVEAQPDLAEGPEGENVTVLIGNAASAEILRDAGIEKARMLFVAIPQSFEAGQIVEKARSINPDIRIVARAHSDDEVLYLEKLGADVTIMGEKEIAKRMIAEARAN